MAYTGAGQGQQPPLRPGLQLILQLPPKNIIKNFSETLTSRLEKDQLKAEPKDRKTADEIQTLVDTLRRLRK